MAREDGALEPAERSHGRFCMANDRPEVVVGPAQEERLRSQLVWGGVCQRAGATTFVLKVVLAIVIPSDVGAAISEKTFSTGEGKKVRKNWVPPWMQEPAWFACWT